VQTAEYSSSFYESQEESSIQSARVILPLIFKIHRPNSVVDVGCGEGWWLGVAEGLGCKNLRGIDGPWVDPDRLVSKNIRFSRVNLDEKNDLDEKFELCICLEVGEHLLPVRAEALVASLCDMSDIVLFSAAIPLQGGVNHVNEQWQSFWAGLFAARGFNCYDAIRPAVWTDNRVSSWYRQNALLYIKASHPAAQAAQTAAFSSRGPVDVVHPEIFNGNLRGLQRAIQEPTLRLCLDVLGKWSRRQVRRILQPRADHTS
jgi:hypothetical protein